VEESVNTSQMDIKRKTCDIRTRKKHFILDISSTNIGTLVQSKKVRRNLEHRSLFTVVSATSAPQFQPLLHQRNIYH
jgi:hypothetical protein